MARVKGLKADILSAIALRRSNWRNCGLCVYLYSENGAMLLVGIWWQENKNILAEWKAFVDTIWLKSAYLKDNFCSGVMQPSELPRCRERPQSAICCQEWLCRLKYLATGLDESLWFLSTLWRCYGYVGSWGFKPQTTATLRS